MEKSILLIGRGYIGSALENHLKQDYQIRPIDIGWFNTGQQDYDLLTIKEVQEHDTIILTAGHSSVGQCRGNFLPAYKNNVNNFVNLLGKLKDSQKLIYISSASVYGNAMEEGEPSSEFDKLSAPMNEYDATKQAIDSLAEASGRHLYGLRLGTVCGVSPIQRTELLINSMVLSAKNTGIIKVSSSDKWRAVLGINDLCAAVDVIIKKGRPVLGGVYNLASFSSKIGDLADEVSKETGAKVEVGQHSSGPTSYSFSMSTSKFRGGFSFAFRETAKSIIKDLAQLEITEEQRKTLHRNEPRNYF